MIQYLVFLGAAVQLIGIIAYIKETIKGNTKPNKVTWLMWAVAPLIATAAALSDGVRLAVLPVFMSGFGPLLVFIVSLSSKKAYWKLERFDYFCGAFSILALVLWVITKEPTVAIIFAILSDGFAAIPTLVKMWKYPETESPGPFIGGLFSILTSFAAIKIWNFSSLAFPIYLISINVALLFSLYRKRLFKNKP